MSSEILWSPQSNIVENSALSKFSKELGFDNNSYEKLHSWSINK